MGEGERFMRLTVAGRALSGVRRAVRFASALLPDPPVSHTGAIRLMHSYPLRCVAALHSAQ
ncbi:hypothetical protein GCM10017784_23030 [Deinococcus indicus]|nr:hypothetical protein GCM10017784_23030 [Deinococcus indicus]